MRKPFKRKDRGNKYYCEIGGRKYSLKTTDKQKAWTKFYKLQKAYHDSKIFPDYSSRTLDKVIPEYLKVREQLAYNTYRTDKLTLNTFKEFIGAKIKINAISLKDLNFFTRYCTVKRNLSKSTINIHIAHLKSFFNTLIDWKYIKENPTKGLKKFKVEKKDIPILTEKQRDLLLLYSQQHEELKYIVPILLFTGTSRVEFTRNINISDKNISYNRTKTKKYVQIPIAEKLRPYIIDLIPGSYTFWDRDISRFGKTFSKFIKQSQIKALKSGINLPYLTLKDIRSNVAVKLLERTGDPELVADIIGHSDRGVTLLRNYTHVLNHKKKEVINLL